MSAVNIDSSIWGSVVSFNYYPIISLNLNSGIVIDIKFKNIVLLSEQFGDRSPITSGTAVKLRMLVELTLSVPKDNTQIE